VISPAIIQLCEEIRATGGRGLLVGGWVRDRLRGIALEIDYDLEVYGLETGRLRALLASRGAVNAVGESFKVFKLRLPTPGEQTESLIVDVSLPRRESKTGPGHRGFEVTGDPWMSFSEAARRRDFTINAIMYDPLTDEYLDPHGGREDLARGLLRAVDPVTFIDDSLRVLRAVQFAARFEYAIEASTRLLCRSIALADLPAERIWGEVEKWLLGARRPSLGLQAARELGVTAQLWPEIEAQIDETAAPDAFTVTALALDAARPLIDDLPRPKGLAVMLAALAHAFGPEETAAGAARLFLDRLKLYTIGGYDVRRQTLALIRRQRLPRHYFESERRGKGVSDGEFRRLAREVELGLLARVAQAIERDDREIGAWFLARAVALGVAERAPAPLLKGRHLIELGVAPGPEMGRIIGQVYERQLDGEITALEEAIATARAIIAAPS
jgi:tRNA nucleotidyltransferase (CCA-adding enzyme)